MAGPGLRFCIWVQGCSRHCPGCMARETWSHDGGIATDTKLLFEQIVDTPKIEGVTFLGGEPFEQAEALGVLAKKIQHAGLSVTTFTGFTYKELLVLNNSHVAQLIAATDLLIDGSFLREQFSLTRPWIGSSNQQFHFLSSRYNEDDLSEARNQIEVRIDLDGKALVNGMGDFSKIKELL